jgi:hypothetical protein
MIFSLQDWCVIQRSLQRRRCNPQLNMDSQVTSIDPLEITLVHLKKKIQIAHQNRYGKVSRLHYVSDPSVKNSGAVWHENTCGSEIGSFLILCGGKCDLLYGFFAKEGNYLWAEGIGLSASNGSDFRDNIDRATTATMKFISKDGV